MSQAGPGGGAGRVARGALEGKQLLAGSLPPGDDHSLSSLTARAADCGVPFAPRICPR
jgi:hypothetical protein